MQRTFQWRHFELLAGLFVLIAAVRPLAGCSDSEVAPHEVVSAPKFQVDPAWPKQLPNPPSDADPGPYNPSAPPAAQFRNPVHRVWISNDDLVYVCDRVNDRIQIFTKARVFVKEFFVRNATLGNGSTWDLSFSKDRAQKYQVVIDGENNVIWTLDRDAGVDTSKRMQKFVLQGG